MAQGGATVTRNRDASNDIAAWVANFSPDTLALNADKMRPAADDATTLEANAGAVGVDAPNPLAARFEALWQQHGGPELTKEYRFAPPRRWRADYAIPAVKVLIELEGGIYSGGRHTRADGYKGDIEKYNAASMLGWAVLRLGTGQVDAAHVGGIVEWLREGVR